MMILFSSAKNLAQQNSGFRKYNNKVESEAPLSIIYFQRVHFRVEAFLSKRLKDKSIIRPSFRLCINKITVCLFKTKKLVAQVI